MVDGGRRWTYGEIDDAADRLASALWRHGIRAQDRIIVQLPNVAELILVCCAMFRMGALPILVEPGRGAREISYLCEMSEAVGYLAADMYRGTDHRRLARELTPAPQHVFVLGDAEEFTSLTKLIAHETASPKQFPEPDPRDTALFLLPESRAVPPRLIPRTHNDYEFNARASAEVCRLDEETVYLAMLPVSHHVALACPGVLGTMYAGGTVVLAPSSRPSEVFPIVERERVTVTALGPVMSALWATSVPYVRPEPSSLRLLQIDGTGLAAESVRRLRDVLRCTVQQVYATADGLLNVTRLDDPLETVDSTQGRPVTADDEIRIVDEHGLDVEAGRAGELLARNPFTARGYSGVGQDGPNDTGTFTPDGFHRSGDLVRRTPTGHLIVVRRNVYPAARDGTPDCTGYARRGIRRRS